MSKVSINTDLFKEQISFIKLDLDNTKMQDFLNELNNDEEVKNRVSFPLTSEHKFIVAINKRWIGVCFVNKTYCAKDAAEIRIAIRKGCRYLGLGSIALTRISEEIFEQNYADKIILEINRNNDLALKSAGNAGFHYDSSISEKFLAEGIDNKVPLVKNNYKKAKIKSGENRWKK